MAKELPYFKFEPAEWMVGNISICDMETQGLFINICVLYWLKNCSICLAFAKQKYILLEEKLNLLISLEIIKVDANNNIHIEFLDNQLKELNEISEKRAESGKSGGKANAKQMLSKSKAIANIKEEKRREYINNNYSDFFLDFCDAYRSITSRSIKDEEKPEIWYEFEQLSYEDQKQAFEGIRYYYDSIDNKRYVKGALKYLVERIFEGLKNSTITPLPGKLHQKFIENGNRKNTTPGD